MDKRKINKSEQVYEEIFNPLGQTYASFMVFLERRLENKQILESHKIWWNEEGKIWRISSIKYLHNDKNGHPVFQKMELTPSKKTHLIQLAIRSMIKKLEGMELS